MGMQLKIDSDETYGLAAELASLRGESIGDAVTRALREALERDRKACEEKTARKQQIEEKIARVRAIAANIRGDLQHPLPSSDHDYLYDYLYDDGAVSLKPSDGPE